MRIRTIGSRSVVVAGGNNADKQAFGRVHRRYHHVPNLKLPQEASNLPNVQPAALLPVIWIRGIVKGAKSSFVAPRDAR